MSTITGSADVYWDGLDVQVDRVRPGTSDITWGALGIAIDTMPATIGGTITADWGALDVEAFAGDDITVTVFDAETGLTMLAAGSVDATVGYRDEISKVGTLSVAMPLDDPAAARVTDGVFVKATWRGVTVGGRVSSEGCSLAQNGSRKLQMQMPTMLGILTDGPVYPDGGLPASGVIDPASPTSRMIGPMNKPGPWLIPAQWSRPMGVRQSDDTIHANFPIELQQQNPYWIAPYPGPVVDQPAGTVAQYRLRRHVSTVVTCEAWFTADNYLDFYVDSQAIIRPDYQTALAWKKIYKQTFTLQPGDHDFYARVENGDPTGRHVNPLGLIGVVYTLDRTGTPNGVLFMTDPVHWITTTETVGWYPGQALYQFVKECQDAGDDGPSKLRMTFTPTHDSAGRPWSGTPGTFGPFNVQTNTLVDVIAKLSDAGLDVWVDARTMTLNAWQRLSLSSRMGADVSSTVHLRLGDDPTTPGALLKYDTQTQYTRFTVAVAQLADGRFHTYPKTLPSGTPRRVLAVQLGSITSPEAAELVMKQMLEQSNQPTISATAQPSSSDGDQLYRKYWLGYTISTPGARGTGTLRQRATAINVDGTGPRVKGWPELIIDRSTA